jgi:putative oxidoreductase
MNGKTIAWWAVRVLLAAGMIFFALPKLTGDPSAVGMFQALGTEPWLRFVTGALELLSAVLLLIPRTVLYGAGLTLLLMLGAIGSHIAVLGFDFPFPVAVLFLALGAAILWMARQRTATA